MAARDRAGRARGRARKAPRALEDPQPIATASVGMEPVAPDAELVVEWTAPTGEPAAPDAEPAVEWSDPVDSPERAPVQAASEPPRTRVDAPDAAWAPPEFIRTESVEPPAPDAEPYVEAAPPPEPPMALWPAPIAAVAPVRAAEAPAPPPPSAAKPSDSPAPAVAEPPPAGPTIVPASGPPPRALMLGTERRDYPLLRGAIVKLAHDDAATAGRVLAALLPAQGA